MILAEFQDAPRIFAGRLKRRFRQPGTILKLH